MNQEFRAPNKRGPKPLGDAPMTSAERQRRRREQARAAGGKAYQVQLSGLHQGWVDALASAQGISGTAVLQGLMEATLDRYAGLMERCDRLRQAGAPDEVVAAFFGQHFMPRLPDINNVEVTTLQQ
jgi:hypothetical protein